MDDILEIKETKYSPKIFFDSKKNILDIKGKSYPENTAVFYKPVFLWLEEYLGRLGKEKVTVNVHLTYFNSSSSKILMNLFDILDEKVVKGKDITVNWIYDEDDENILEYGEEFLEDTEALKFNLIPKKG